MDIPESYWNNTSNCLKETRISTQVFYPNSIVLNSTDCSSYSSYDELKRRTMNTQYLNIQDCRLPIDVIESENTTRILKDNNLINSDETYEDFFRDLLRILLNPSSEIKYSVQLYMNEYFFEKEVIGIHVRTGGCIANFQEQKAMMTIKQIQSLPDYIMEVMKKSHLEPKSTTIFLSTDSDIIEEYLRNKLESNIEIITSHIYMRSHSRGKAVATAVKGAITDLYLLAQCKVLITCSGSGFSRIAYYLSSATMKYMYQTTHSIVDNWVSKTKNCSHIPDLFNSNINAL